MAADAVHVLADEPWHDAALIPVGVLRVSAAAGADALPGDAPSGSTRLCFLAADAVLALGERCSGAERDAVCALAWLVRERRARAAAERAWLRDASAGGDLTLYVYAREAMPPVTPSRRGRNVHTAEASAAVPHWLAVLRRTLVDPRDWRSASGPGTQFWNVALNAWSLAELYRRLPSPPTTEHATVLDAVHADEWMRTDEGAYMPAMLSCTLFDYQRNSLVKMLQRELQPHSYCDPYFVQHASPCEMSGGERTYAFDPKHCTFHRLSHVSVYPDHKGGVLCDEMGVGKTIICLALILGTRAQVPVPDQEPMASCVTSELALTFPQEDYQGGDPAAAALESERVVTAAFGAPSPGERISRRGRRSGSPVNAAAAAAVLEPEPATPPRPPVPERQEAPKRLPLLALCAHRLRTCTAPADLDALPPPLRELLGDRTAPFFHLWPPPPTRLSRVSHVREPLRVYLSAATLVLVPLTLLVQWTEEIAKHCRPGSLRVLALSDAKAELPPPLRLAQDYDLVLMSHARFGKEAGDEQQGLRSDLDASPLMQVYWKRVIIDEGNILAGDSLVVRLCSRLRVERRWIVTGTPTQALVGASLRAAGDDGAHAVHSEAAPTAWTPAERRNLDRLKALLVRFLRLAPFCTSAGSAALAARAAGLASGKERDWNMLMASPASDTAELEWTAKRRLYDTLARVMVRNRAEDVDRECPLPPLRRRTVALDLSPLERRTYNVLQALILLNAVLSQEEDRDYFFHAANRKALAAVMENLALACFHFAGEGFLEQTLSAHALIRAQLARPDAVRPAQRPLADAALAKLQEALDNLAWRAHVEQGEVLYHVDHLDTDIAEAWRRHRAGDIHALSSDELLALRHACEAAYDELAADAAPSDAGVNGTAALPPPDADELHEELLTRGMRFLARLSGKPEQAPQRPENLTTVASDRRSAERGLKRARASVPHSSRGSLQHPQAPRLRHLPHELQRIRVQRTSSTKLNAIVDEVRGAADTDKVLVFSSLDNVLYELAGALELAQIPYLLYVSGLPQRLRNEYASAFSHVPAYRCLLMSTHVGGRGLDLHCATRVILAEPVWQADLESQVVKRAWRMGQTRPVTVSTYVMRQTFEEHLVQRKQARLASAAEAASPGARQLTDDPGMRDFVAHPRFVEPSPEEMTGEAGQAQDWDLGLFHRHHPWFESADATAPADMPLKRPRYSPPGAQP